MRSIAFLAACLTLSSMALAQPATQPAKAPSTTAYPPPYTPVRWNENYLYLRDPANRTDFWDPIKYIPLNEEGDWYLSLGGQARYRYEFFDKLGFGAPNVRQDGDGYHLFRFMGHVDAHFGPHLRTFVQAKSAWVADREGGPRGSVINGHFVSTDEDEIDIQQAFADVIVPIEDFSLTLRGGRQDLLYGAQRLISPLDWTNTRRTFEGFKASLAYKPHTTDVFVVRPVFMRRTRANRGDEDTTFAGVYHVLNAPGFMGGQGSRFDLYALGLFTRPASPAADQDRYTLGARFFTNPKPFDYDIEAAWQFGDQGDASIRAWMLATDLGYTMADVPMSPRINLGFDIASGDRDPTDRRAGTFNQHFPLGHAYLGYIDVIGRQNIIDLRPGLTLNPARNVKFTIDYHLFWRQSRDDAVYNAGGGVLRADTGTDARFIGSELDLLLTWQVDRHLSTYVGYSRFWTGAFIERTGPSRNIDFFYLALQYTF